jgi:hypothetical protein
MNVTAVQTAAVSMDDRRAMNSPSALKIGLFGANCSSGRAVTLVPERWTGSWEDNLGGIAALFLATARGGPRARG